MRASRGRTTGTVVATFLVALNAAGCGSLSTRPPYAVHLTGTWLLNESQSNGLTALSQSNRDIGGDGSRGMRRSGGGMGGGEGGGGGHGRGGGRRGEGGERRGGAGPDPDSDAGAQQGRGRNATVQRPKKLLIEQGDATLTLLADGTSTVYAYGANSAIPFGTGTAQGTAGWKATDFVVKLEVKDGPKIAWTYEVSDDGGKLFVEKVTNRGNGRPDQKVIAVYEREGTSTSAVPPSGK